jgi:hypothetical protein
MTDPLRTHLRFARQKRLTRRQGEILLRALATIDEREMFQTTELRCFREGFDKLAAAWRKAVETEEAKGRKRHAEDSSHGEVSRAS